MKKILSDDLRSGGHPPAAHKPIPLDLYTRIPEGFFIFGGRFDPSRRGAGGARVSRNNHNGELKNG